MKLKVPTLWGMIVQGEMRLTRDFVLLLEQRLPEWMGNVEMEIDSAPLADDDDASLVAAEQEYERHQALQIATRPIAYAAFLAVWSMYESTVEAIALKCVGAISRSNGDFIQRARRCFDRELKLPLHPQFQKDEWKYLSGVCALRNVVAHQNGNLRNADGKKQSAVQELMKVESRLSVTAAGYVVVPIVFSRQLCDKLYGALDDLLVRAHSN